MRMESKRILEELRKRFHSLPLDKDFLKTFFGKKGEMIYEVLLEALEKNEVYEVNSVDQVIVCLDKIKRR